MNSKQKWILVLAALAAFMTALDTLVVTTALPVLRVALKAGITDLEWTVNAYNLSFACFLLTGAALGDRFGRKQMFALGITVFTAASAAAALSPSVGALIAARALQGAGAAIIMPLTLTLISAAFPAEKRGMAIGLWGGIAGLAVAAGPVVGGAVAGGINWHWIFWLNIPVGAALIPLAITKLTESYGPRPRLDLTGLALAGAGLLGIAWGLVRGNDAGWSSAEIITALSGGAVLLVAFIGWEARSSHPMLPLGLFRSRGFASANGVSFFMYAGLFGTLFLMAQFLQSALAGTLADRYGNRRFMVAGLAAQAIGYGWVAAIAATGMSNFMLAAALTVAGVGTSLCFPTVANAVLGSVPPSEAGVASGTNSAIREIGGVLGVAVLAAVFTSHGGYTSPHVFIEGFRPALWAGAGFSALGIVAALAGGRHAAKEKAALETVPELVATI
jgi:MFS family permease